jgi:GNAT superfamily N-acetyltransferase
MMPADANGRLRIVPARREDAPLILSFIRELAEYEKLAGDVVATEATLAEELFGARPVAEVLLGYEGVTPVGFAVFFHNFSTFVGRRGLYLEDLFVRPEHRGKGYGRAFLIELARIAAARGCGRFEWAVLDWNEPAIRFYKKLGAVAKDEWTVFRVDGAALADLATGKPTG